MAIMYGDRRRFIFSIVKLENCLNKRRRGIEGTVIGNYSIKIRLFGKDLF